MFRIFQIVIHSRTVVFAYYYTREQEINHIVWTKHKLFYIKMFEYKMNKFTNVHLKVEYSMYFIKYFIKRGVVLMLSGYPYNTHYVTTVWRALPLTFC